MINSVVSNSISDIISNIYSGEIGSRLIPTFAGSQYGTLDTPITAAAGDTVEIKFATTSTGTPIMLVDGDGASDRGYIQFTTGNVITWDPAEITAVTLDGSAVVRNSTASPSDGKVHTIIATLAVGARLGTIGADFTGGSDFIGQILSVKVSLAAGTVVANYVFDSGSDLYQFPRGEGLGDELWNNTTTIPFGSQINHTTALALISGKTYALKVSGLSAGEDTRYVNSGWQLLSNDVELVFISAANQPLSLRDFVEAQTDVTVTIRQLPDSVCLLTNFATSDWNRYTLQRNITHDAGVIGEAWAGDELVINGRFDDGLTGWTVSNATVIDGQAIFGSGGGFIFQDVSVINGHNILMARDLIGAPSSPNTPEGISLPATTLSPTSARIQVNGSEGEGVDNASLRQLLEVA